MKKAIAIVIQILIFVGAWFILTPDTLEDNTYIFGLLGNVEVIPGNTRWVLLGAMFLSVINILIWWPKVKITNTVKESKGDKNAEAKAADPDPIVPKMD